MGADPVRPPSVGPGDCLHRFVDGQASQDPDAVAILAPGRRPLTYGGLSRQVAEVVAALNVRGLGRNDRIATVLSEGPEMAVASIAVASGATCAPLNPAYCAREFDLCLTDLGAKALLVPSGGESPALDVARSRGIPVLELVPQTGAEAGLFTLAGEGRPGAARGGFAEPEDAALALHTSGTTASPKLVPLTHRNLCVSACNIRDAVQLGKTDRCLNVMPLFHIHGLSTIYASLAAGASVVCTSGFSPSAFFEWLAAFRPTWYSAAPTIHQIILENALRHPEITARSGLRFIRSASAAMPRQTIEGMERAWRAPFIEAYGMTEAAPQVASNRLPPHERKAGSVGPAAGPDVAIMDEAGHLLPSGRPGEVVIRGANVMRAYENNHAANRDAFVRGWFRTGDSGYLDADGHLFITGRLKEIINRGGEKISPREVDEVLMAHPEVSQAVAFAVPHPLLGENVAAAVVLKSGSPARACAGVSAVASERLVQDIRSFAAKRLAPFKVPQQIVILDEMPEGPSRKLRRNELAQRLRLVASKTRQGATQAVPAPPRTPTEQKVADIWADVLGLDRLGIHDNFFHLGGHSLAATQVLGRLQNEFQVELGMDSLFERPTVAGLAEWIAQRTARLVRGGRMPQERGPSSTAETAPGVSPIPRRRAPGPFPLSFAQQRLWFLDRMATGNVAYNMSASLRLTGPLDSAVLERSLNEVRRRHETLRTTFPLVRQHPVQVIAPSKPMRLPVADLTVLPSSDRETEMLRLAAEEARRPFDLARGPLFRSTLVRLGPEEHVLLLILHHIISDGWSTGVLHRELGALYGAFTAGRASPLPEPPIRYADFAVWQRGWLRGEALEAHLAYWKEQLRDVPCPVAMPTDRPRPAFQTYRGAGRRMPISRPLTEALKALSRREEATLFMTLLAAFQTLIFRYTGEDDVAVGVPIANRTHPETEALIGFFANTLVLRTDLSGGPRFPDLLRRVRATALGAYAHQDLPFEKLVEELQPERSPGHVPLFRVMLAFQNLPDPTAAPRPGNALVGGTFGALPPNDDGRTAERPVGFAPGLNARPFEVESGTAKFDLTLYLSETEHGLAGVWQYNVDLFEAATVERLAGYFRALLEGIAADPDRRLSEFPLLTDSERRRLAVEWNRTEAPCRPDRCFHHVFEKQAALTPDAVAVEYEEERLSYSELNARANQLARRLQGLGVGPETLVGICLGRSAEMVTAVLGVWKAGGAYLPLDPQYPAQRLAFMLEDARVSVLVTEERLLALLGTGPGVSRRSSGGEQSNGQASGPGGTALVCLDADRQAIAAESKENPRSAVTAANLAYVIYTSGSTGRPKGVMITHANVCHYVQAMREATGIAAADRYLHTASFAFSSSVRQFAVPLSCGAAVVVARADEVRDPRALLDLVSRRRASVLDIVPSYGRSCIHVLQALEPPCRAALLDGELRLVLSASEPLPADLSQQWASCLRSGARLINMFGQTETTGIVTVYPIPAPGDGAAKIVPIGRPIANTRVYLLDAARQPVPVGVCGEVYVGGAGVGRGYLNRPDLTAKRFVTDPFSANPDARLYRTGDMARYRPDGNIEFIGRADSQIKVRGFRIEPGEIEYALRQHPWVGDAVVVASRAVSATDVDTAANANAPNAGGSQRLAAFVVPRERAQPSVPSGVAKEGSRPPERPTMELREFLKRSLPEYMVPSAIVELEALPLTPNGKVDRKALSARFAVGDDLREPQSRRKGRARAFAAPRTLAEKALAAIWERVLRVDRVGIEDNFFDLGGDSILSIQVIMQANQAGLPLSLRQLFQYQTVAELARVAGAPRRAPIKQKAATDTVGLQGPTPKEAEPMVLVTMDSLRAYGREALERAGLSPQGAAVVTEVQLEASLRGQPTHNMGSIPRYARRIASGVINPHPWIRVEHETAISARMDGDNGPGQWVGVVATQTAIRKARERGMAMVAARRSNHFGAAGHYAWMAAREGLIGLCTTNGPVVLAPTGGLTPTFGNNPLGVGIPAARYPPILLDIAMSVAPRGKIGLHLAEGRPLPPGWILDRSGRSSTDLADLAAGLSVPIGGHKGYGLALVMEALAGALTGAGFCWDHSREQMQQGTRPPDLGHFFMVIDPGLFMPLADFTARVDSMIEQAKTGDRVENGNEVLVPGEAELRARERNVREGVPLRPSTYRTLLKYGEEAALNADLVVTSTVSSDRTP